jgi:formate dehydrogenase iron-sulfur subunit
MVNGVSSKCDGCAATTKAGGDPWCVVTCPSRALEFGERSAILAEAKRRVSALQGRYPNAQLYGEEQAGGLGVLVVAPDDPEELDLPRDPQRPLGASLWTGIVQPASLGLTAVTAVAAGALAVIARRNHLEELRQLEAEKEGAPVSRLDAAPGEELNDD